MAATYYIGSNRFNFLRSAIPNDWTDGGGNSPAHGLHVMLWSTLTTDVWWECHDGVTDDFPGIEEATTLEACLHFRSSKRFIYVKPNWSDVKCTQHRAIAQREGIDIVTCAPWSYYDKVMFGDVRAYARRNELRKMVLSRDLRVKFLGRLTDSRLPVLKQAQQTYGYAFSINGGLLPQQYVSEVVSASHCLQPHGIGLRHSIYECMALGVPSIIPESSYMHATTRHANLVYQKALPILYGRSTELEKACIDVYETYMTPEAIVGSVLKRL
jgi:hypothetical protein